MRRRTALHVTRADRARPEAVVADRSGSASLVAPRRAIDRFLGEHDRDPRPFAWTADPDRIVEKVRRTHHPSAVSG
jgi:hypothetical protein